MDIMQMLPLLMMMNGQKGKSQGSMDMATMMNMMSMMGGKAPFGGQAGTQNATQSTSSRPLNPDTSKIEGMLSPEMLALLSQLGRKND